jgi:phosphatidylethanolamine/phosphatidyl-N-methylethanolamine N-methyltransferase
VRWLGLATLSDCEAQHRSVLMMCNQQDAPLSQPLRPLPIFEEAKRSGLRFARRIAKDVQIGDEARFIRSWLDKPLITGAVSPSSRALARKMAHYVDPAVAGAVLEIGPGTGPVTEALIRRGVREDRLVLLEFNPEFCRLLRGRFPKARVIEGDAYDLGRTLAGVFDAPLAATISSLPLFTRPEDQRLSLLEAAFELMHPGMPFIQFTYATVSPMPLKSGGFEAKVSPRIWLNLPPACVWVYRKTAA